MNSRGFSSDKQNLLELLLAKSENSQTIPDDIAFTPFQIDGRDAFPLSFSQRRLWFLDQLEPENAFYNFPLAVPFQTAVNTAVLRNSVDEIVRRHEALRTVFVAVEGEPVQIVIPNLSVPLTVVDLHHLDKNNQDAEIIRQATEASQRPFDLAHGPLLRTTLLRRGPKDHVFLLVMHHIISDGWSLGIFWRELVALYNAFYAGAPSPLPELPIQYADFAVWQRQRLRGEKLAELVSHWKQKLEGMPTLQLPTDRPRPPVMSYRGAFQELIFPRALTDALRTLSQRENATLFMTLFASFAVLLQKYTAQHDIVVGSYVASRDRAEVEELIGFFINTLVLRADLSGNPTFRTLLGRVREMALEAYEHQELPFEKLVEELQPERDLSRNPLFQVSFQLFSPQSNRGALRVGEGAPTIDLNRGMAIFDIAVNIWDGPDGLSGHIEYSSDLFDADTISRFVGHFRTLLTNIVTNPEAKLSDLRVLGEMERRQLIYGWNNTRSDIPDQPVHELFEQQARRCPDSIAITASGQEVSYADLEARSSQLAARLRAAGVERGAHVGICIERGVNMILGILAILKSGAAFVPFDPSYPAPRLAFMLKDSQVKIVLSDIGTAGKLPWSDAAMLLLDDMAAVDAPANAKHQIAVAPDDLCYLIYTSGSTGNPKGVMGSHKGTVNRLQWMWSVYPFEPGEVVCQKTALSFVDSIWEIFGGLLQGVRTVVLADELVKDPRRLVDELAAAKVTRIVVVPSLLQALQNSGIDLAEELPSLKYWTVSGEAFPYGLYVEFQKSVPHAHVLNLYGSSEVAADVLCCDLSKFDPTTRSVPIGRPIANTQVYVLDRHRELVPVGVPGELYVGGYGLARGYYGQPQLTADAFVTNPFSDTLSDRLYKTRDQVRYRSDGQLEYLGRLDHQVKLRGYRVELGEIETVLADHSGIQEVVASIVQVHGEAPRLVAHIVLRDSAVAKQGSNFNSELASHWQTVWNETYLAAAVGGGFFDTAGWNSSYTGKPIPADEMREWVEQTVERALSFKPQRVLEIGCGTGLILLRVAPHCATYVGTDFSRVALDKIRTEIERTPELYGSVQLYERTALESDRFEDPFDLVILNSVIQYFPSVEYLTQVLDAAYRVTAPTGAILIGDVRSLPLLRAFHTAVELHDSPDTLSVDVLVARIDQKISQEKELALDPLAFHEFVPDTCQVTVDLKRGNRANEVVQFRYDVAVRREKAPKSLLATEWLDWEARDLTLDSVRSTLETERPETLAISGVPNARIGAAMKAVELLSSVSFGSVGDLRRCIGEPGQEGIDPEKIWALGADLDYCVCVGFRGSGEDGRYDAVFRRRDTSPEPLSFGFLSTRPEGGPANEILVTSPIASIRTQRLLVDLRAHLRSRLPDYMVPASIVVLEKLPRTPNGKVDRRSLTAPDAHREGLGNTYVAPRNATEQLVAAIWTDLLNIQRVGVFDNFFELGGHSLLAMQLISRIRLEFTNEMPVRDIFEGPTIAALAAKLDLSAGRKSHSSKPTIQRVPRDVTEVSDAMKPNHDSHQQA